jgi:dTDP-4-dehydrorhamnose 3,5-epimerase-like enzyme
MVTNFLVAAGTTESHSRKDTIPSIIIGQRNALMNEKLHITELSDRGDARGFSFTAPAEALAFVGRMADVHLASTRPGAVRGNHYHVRRRQAIMALPGMKWSLHWDEGEGSPAQHREFEGSRSVLVLLSPGPSIAVRNDGDGDLWIVTISSEAFDPADSIPRKVV